MYYIMRKSYFVMQNLLGYVRPMRKKYMGYAIIITLCVNYYVMGRHTRARVCIDLYVLLQYKITPNVSCCFITQNTLRPQAIACLT